MLGGDWSPAQKPWESRKDSILDVLAKAVPGAFKPARQINATEARLLIDALSGRWSYEKNRRDTRTVWHYVADAFSCAIGRVEPDGPVKPKTVTVITARSDRRDYLQAGTLRQRTKTVGSVIYAG